MQYEKVHIMQKEQDPLNLRSLPLVAPPSDGWPVVKAALVGTRERQRMRRYFGGFLAAAATLALVVGISLQQPIPETPVAVKSAPNTLDSLIDLSQTLEVRIRTIRSATGGMPTDALIYQVELEDLIVQVDDELSQRPDSLKLWSQRVNLLLDLNKLYQNQLRRDYHRMASL